MMYFCKQPFRLARTGLDNVLVAVTGKKAKRGPLFVSWDISGTCNARCVMCDRWTKPVAEISTEQKICAIEDMADAGVWAVSVCGGEPFLMKDLHTVVSTIKKNNMVVNVTTNGSLISEHTDSVKDLDVLTISVDSHKQNVHDAWRGMEGLHASILESLSDIRSWKRRPRVYVRQVLHAANIREVEEYVAFWKDKVDEIVFQPIHHSPQIGFTNPESTSCLQISDEMVEQYFSALKSHGLLNAYHQGIPGFLRNDREKSNVSCYAGFFSLDIDAAGTVWNCGEHMHPLGNVCESRILDMLNTHRAVLRERSQKPLCSCYHNCAIINKYMHGICRVFSGHT
jgi:MoaA/NifB/PqqE/SkfB family radical SAM enzyme